MVIVKFPQEGSGGGYGSLEDNFTLKEYVYIFSIGVGCTPCIANFSMDSSNHDERVSNRWTHRASTGVGCLGWKKSTVRP